MPAYGYWDCHRDNCDREDTIGAQGRTLTALCDALDHGSVSVAELRVVTALVRGGMSLPDAVEMSRAAAAGAQERGR